MSETLFVMNPKSGTTTSSQKEKIIQLIKKNNANSLIFTESAGHATEIAQDAAQRNIPRVVAVGGDGTVNEVGKGLINSETALGIVPIGSGNGLARHLKIPLNIGRAINYARQAEINKMDVCFVNEIPFFCTAGVGFDAFVANEFSKKTSRGLKTYAKTALQSFRNYHSESYEIEIENKVSEHTAFAITFANATQYGNNAMISPQSKINDGLIDMVILRPFPFGAAPIIGVRLFRGTLPNSRYVDVQNGTEFQLTSKNPTLIHFDGEPHQMNTNELTIKVLPEGLNVIGKC
jgi:diacylglycerol kinase (ATP)